MKKSKLYDLFEIYHNSSDLSYENHNIYDLFEGKNKESFELKTHLTMYPFLLETN